MRSRLLAFTAVAVLALASASPSAQSKGKAAAPQKNDEAYTRLIREYLQDSRITTELVDHLPTSDTVPSPLKFLGRVVGAPGELTYARDIYRYSKPLPKPRPALRKSSKVARTKEGPDSGLS